MDNQPQAHVRVSSPRGGKNPRQAGPGIAAVKKIQAAWRNKVHMLAEATRMEAAVKKIQAAWRNKVKGSLLQKKEKLFNLLRLKKLFDGLAEATGMDSGLPIIGIVMRFT